MSDDNKKGLEALKHLLAAYDYLDSSYKQEFGEESPYKLEEESENLLRQVIKKSEEDK